MVCVLSSPLPTRHSNSYEPQTKPRVARATEGGALARACTAMRPLGGASAKSQQMLQGRPPRCLSLFPSVHLCCPGWDLGLPGSEPPQQAVLLAAFQPWDMACHYDPEAHLVPIPSRVHHRAGDPLMPNASCFVKPEPSSKNRSTHQKDPAHMGTFPADRLPGSEHGRPGRGAASPGRSCGEAAGTREKHEAGKMAQGSRWHRQTVVRGRGSPCGHAPQGQ